jgi:hypothetical protein
MDVFQNFFNFIDNYNINNNQNYRYLIIGGSGSRKTSLAISLILCDLPRHNKIHFLLGSTNLLINNLKKDFIENGIEVEIHYIDTVNDLNNLMEKNLIINKNELVLIDDLSHLFNASKKFTQFLNKIFTASRQNGYDVILILHKLKFMNPLLRQNSTRILFTSKNKEVSNFLSENFDKNEVNKLNPPFSYNISGGSIDSVNIPELNFDKIKFDKDLPKIIKLNKAPKYIEKEGLQFRENDKDNKKEVVTGLQNAITSKKKNIRDFM